METADGVYLRNYLGCCCRVSHQEVTGLTMSRKGSCLRLRRSRPVTPPSPPPSPATIFI